MIGSGIIGFILIIVNFLVSYRGFNNRFFYEKYEFGVDKILLYKDYKRLITSGFLHVNWMHLIFNMLALFFFSGSIESHLGAVKFLIIYFASLLGGNLFSLLVYKRQGDYTSVGASGAINGVIFAAIALFPGLRVGFFFIPMPGWLFGILFVAYAIYGVRSRKGNIGHEAHLAGALVGMLVALLMEPTAIITNYITILIIAVPSMVFIYLIITRPHLLLIDNYFFKTHSHHYSIDHKYNEDKAQKQKEIDRILDKINKKGMSSLTREEKKKLKDYSKST